MSGDGTRRRARQPNARYSAEAAKGPRLSPRAGHRSHLSRRSPHRTAADLHAIATDDEEDYNLEADVTLELEERLRRLEAQEARTGIGSPTLNGQQAAEEALEEEVQQRLISWEGIHLSAENSLSATDFNSLLVTHVGNPGEPGGAMLTAAEVALRQRQQTEQLDRPTAAAVMIQRWWRAMRMADNRRAVRSWLERERARRVPSPGPAGTPRRGGGKPSQNSLLTSSNLDSLRAAAKRRAGDSDDAAGPQSSPPQPAARKPGAPSTVANSKSKLLSFLDQVDNDEATDRLLSSRASSRGGSSSAGGAVAPRNTASAMSAAGPAEISDVPRSGAPLGHGEPDSRVGAALGAPAGDIPSLQDASEAASSVTQAVLQQRALLEEKSARIGDLELQLRQATTDLDKVRRDAERLDDLGALEADLAECNKTINRHLAFIDRLIKDKKALSKRCEDLVQQMKTADEKYSSRLRVLQDNRDVELKRQKDIIAAAEKMRREKWIKQQTRKIKEATVKGLEPQIHRMVEEHKKQLQRVQSETAQTADVHGGVLKENHQRELSALREKMEAEKLEAVERERARLEKRYQQQAEAEERTIHEQRRKLTADLVEDRERNRQTLIAERKQMEQDVRTARLAEEKAAAALKTDTDRQIEEQTRRHQKELKEIREQLAIEKESWEEMYMRKQEATLKSREEAIRDKLREERDRQIDMVIDRLEAENVKAQQDAEAQVDTRVRRVKEKFDAQLRDLEQSEQACIAKYNTARQRLVESNEEAASLRGAMVQRDRDLAAERAITTQLSSERNKVADVIRVEFAEKLAGSEAEVAQLRRELADSRSSHRSQMNEIQNAKDRELDLLHERVQSTIAKKDATIRMLTEQADAATLRADHLEELLTTQRKQVLGK